VGSLCYSTHTQGQLSFLHQRFLSLRPLPSLARSRLSLPNPTCSLDPRRTQPNPRLDNDRPTDRPTDRQLPPVNARAHLPTASSASSHDHHPQPPGSPEHLVCDPSRAFRKRNKKSGGGGPPLICELKRKNCRREAKQKSITSTVTNWKGVLRLQSCEIPLCRALVVLTAFLSDGPSPRCDGD
jgi:hypothetical protein